MSRFFTRTVRLSGIFAILFSTLSLQAETQPLRLLTDEGKVQIMGRADGKVVGKELGSDEVRPIVVKGLTLSGDEGPSLRNGYSPAHFVIKRERADHHRARRMGGPLHQFRLIVGISLDSPEAQKFWAETDLSKVWDESVLADDRIQLVLGLWGGGRWLHAELFSMETGQAFASASIVLNPNEMAGRPHIFVLKDGGFVQPDKFIASVDGSTIERIQNAAGDSHVASPPTGIGIADSTGMSWLHYAAAWDKSDWIKAWSGPEGSAYSNASIKSLDPLVIASMLGNTAAMSALLDKGFDRHRKDDFGFDAGHMAILYGHFDVVDALIDGGYSVNRPSSDLTMPSSLAYEFGHDDIFSNLLENGASSRWFDRSVSQDHLFTACLRGDLATAKFLMSYRGRLDRKTEAGWSPITLAVRSGNLELVKALLDAGADPNDRSPAPENLSLAMYAIQTGDTELLRLLAENGASLDELTPSGLGLVELATMIGKDDVVAELFAAGATCSMQPHIASEVLIMAISNDIREMAILAFAECVSPNFAFYNSYPMDWVIDYYGAQKTRDWWVNSGYEQTPATEWPEFVRPSQLDTPLQAIAAPQPDYSDDLHARYGRIETSVPIVIHSDGQVLFPRFESDLPHPVRLQFIMALSQWRFLPPTHNGQPAILQAKIPFVLDTESADPLELTDEINPPIGTRTDSPRYPWSLARNRTDGFTQMRFVVTKFGTTKDIHATRSTHPLLSNTSANAISNWLFDPATKNGQPVDLLVRIGIPYRVSR